MPPRALLMSGSGLLLGRAHFWVHRLDTATMSVNVCVSCFTKGRDSIDEQNWPHPSLAATLGTFGPSLDEAFRREGITPHLGSTIALTLFTGAWLSWP